MKKKKILALILLGLGIAVAVAGLIILCQCDESHTGYGYGMSRASTSIEFGADFYTTSAQATGLAANAVIDLYKLTSIIAGILFIFIGGVDICATLLFTDIKELFKKEKPVTVESTEQSIKEA